MRLVTCTEFSLIAEVSKAAITKAKNQNRIIQEDDGKYYDLDLPINDKYLTSIFDRRIARAAKIEAARHPKPKRKSVPRKTASKKNTSGKSGKVKTDKKKPDKKVKEKKTSSAKKVSKHSNIRADIDLKIKQVQLKTNEVKYHQLLGDVVMRDSVRPIFNKIYKAGTYFQDFGQRYAGEWAAILGVTDSDKILDLEKSIDIATEKFMEAFTETVAGEI